MRKPRLQAFILSAITFLSSLFLYLKYIRFAGFPDGFLSEAGRAEKILFGYFVAESMLLGTIFLMLGFRTPSARNVNVMTGIYVVSIVAVIAIDAYIRIHLTGDAGG